MEEIITNVIMVSGVLGVVVNYLVAGAKKVSANDVVAANPRVVNALLSLTGAVSIIVAGGEADIASMENALTVLALAGGSWLVAHITHKVNGI